MRQILRGAPWWGHVLALFGFMLLLSFAAHTAWPDESFQPAVGAGVVPVVAEFWRQRSYWALCRRDRLAVLEATDSGTSTASTTLDQMALDRLTRRARSYRADRVLVPFVLLCVTALFVAAAIRTDDGWWVGGLVVLVAFFTVRGIPADPRPPLAALSGVTT